MISFCASSHLILPRYMSNIWSLVYALWYFIVCFWYLNKYYLLLYVCNHLIFPFLYQHFGFAVCRALWLSPLADWDIGDRLWVVLCTFKGTTFSSSRLCVIWTTITLREPLFPQCSRRRLSEQSLPPLRCPITFGEQRITAKVWFMNTRL